MLQPWVNPRSEFYWFRRRVPAKYLKFGMPPVIKFSLRTKDRDEAVLRCQEENLRLERTWHDNLVGLPVSELSHLQIYALAGEFYEEMVSTHRDEPGRAVLWEDTLRALEKKKRPLINLLPPGAHLRFAFGDEAREFLKKRRLHLVGERFDSFVRAYVQAKERAAAVLLRNANGDYDEAKEPKEYPKLRLTDPKQTFDVLWSDFCKAKLLSASTRKKWEPYFSALIHRVGTTDMTRVTEQHLVDWRDALLASKLSPVTVKDGYMAAMKSFFGWAQRGLKIPTDPCAKIVVEISDKHETEMRGFTDAEAAVILSAALAPMSELMSAENAAARRWVPWICAYTGARVNEITQMRAADVQMVDGIECIRITPEAGRVKTSIERIVPLHPHLIEQGFLTFARRKKGTTPLFYSVERQRKADRKNPTYTSVGNKLAEWVRNLGIRDHLVAPNHGWRHRFKTEGLKVMDSRILDAIQGHAPQTEGGRYGKVPTVLMHRKIRQYPNYEVVAAARRDGRKNKRQAVQSKQA
ncbi:MAG TPA: site-specific integrase [Tardiphaga sp.]